MLSPQAARFNKQFLREYLEKNSQIAGIESMQNAIKSVVTDPYAYAISDEHREGISAFLAKRPPQFR
jgi:enoyl-CoA hydratase